MIVYIPKTQDDHVGGGWTFLRNFRKAMRGFVQFTDRLEDADLVFIPGVTMVDRDEIERAEQLKKPIVFRMDNIPRKSRNRRNRVYDNIKRYAELAQIVVYQSEWARNYCAPMSGPGEVIYNGVDLEIFNQNDALVDAARKNKYLFAYHGKSELKMFWLAHHHFQMEARKNPDAHFTFIYNFKSELAELEDANFDFWNDEKFTYMPPQTSPEVMATLMKECKYLIYPSVSDASPNIVLEARACGMEVIYAAPADLAGTMELLNPNLDISLERMGREYHALFHLVLEDKEIEA